jgi:hypothetical protein
MLEKEIMPYRLEACRNSVKRAAHFTPGQIDWAKIDQVTRKKESTRNSIASHVAGMWASI